jgi:hypothetical protein
MLHVALCTPNGMLRVACCSTRAAACALQIARCNAARCLRSAVRQARVPRRMGRCDTFRRNV